MGDVCWFVRACLDARLDAYLLILVKTNPILKLPVHPCIEFVAVQESDAAEQISYGYINELK